MQWRVDVGESCWPLLHDELACRSAPPRNQFAGRAADNLCNAELRRYYTGSWAMKSAAPSTRQRHQNTGDDSGRAHNHQIASCAVAGVLGDAKRGAVGHQGSGPDPCIRLQRGASESQEPHFELHAAARASFRVTDTAQGHKLYAPRQSVDCQASGCKIPVCPPAKRQFLQHTIGCQQPQWSRVLFVA
ncbi:hypothetical protein WJX84_003265 [Apatococcus fuscideae]|uniref:Uncharacterized protein n=1 Tax=Apatococcus fuscideae TaxID=2026836 RepID=A0AAW1T0Q6_9CHLO